MGRLATKGRVPAATSTTRRRLPKTFVVVDGVRWALPGDMASIEADGTIRLIGRGAMCINTGGERSTPKRWRPCSNPNPDVADAVVVGVPDPRFGERVAAVVQPVAGSALSSFEVLQSHCRGTSPATRCRARCRWSRKSPAPRRGRPITDGRSKWPRPIRAWPAMRTVGARSPAPFLIIWSARGLGVRPMDRGWPSPLSHSCGKSTPRPPYGFVGDRVSRPQCGEVDAHPFASGPCATGAETPSWRLPPLARLGSDKWRPRTCYDDGDVRERISAGAVVYHK